MNCAAVCSKSLVPSWHLDCSRRLVVTFEWDRRICTRRNVIDDGSWLMGDSVTMRRRRTWLLARIELRKHRGTKVSPLTCDDLLLDVSSSAESTRRESFILLRFDLIHVSLGHGVNCSTIIRPCWSNTLNTARSGLLKVAQACLVLKGEMLMIRH